MRFSLVLIILFYSHIFSQSNIYIKYKSSYDVSKGISAVSNYLNQKRSNNQISGSEKGFEFSTLRESFGNLNSKLDNIVKIKLNNKSLEKEVIQLLQNDPSVDYIQVSLQYKITC